MTEPGLPIVFARAEALRAGFTRHQIAHRLGTGEWLALRRAVFIRKDVYDASPPTERLRLLARSARLAMPSLSLVDSHITAAHRWGLPMPVGELPRAALTDGCIRHSPCVDPDLVIQVATLWPGDVLGHADGPLTSLTRTAADCLRHYPADVAVPIADAAIHTGRTSKTAVSQRLADQAGWPYAARAAASLPLVDGRRESWLESVSAIGLFRQGLELAECQVEVLGPRGEFLARVDFLWRDGATVGEADGRGKYWLEALPALAAVDAADLAEAQLVAGRRALACEKDREDALRDAGLEVVRWGTAEMLHRSDQVAGRIRRARARGDLRRFSGRFESPAA